MSKDGLDLAQACRAAAENKKAKDSLILDLREVGGPADYFLLVSGDSEPHLKAIVREIEQEASLDCGRKPLRSAGTAASQWMVLDYGDVLVHVLHIHKRGFYRIEDLWGDAPRIRN